MHPRPIIYQLFPRLFSNSCAQPIPGGSRQENGCGRFADITTTVLDSLAKLGVTHIWFMGIVRHASRTPAADCQLDAAMLVKGEAGSPYSITDYFDAHPDYAVPGESALEAFRELVARCHALGLGVFIDFVPNHVARNYHSHHGEPFGELDQTQHFFHRDNHFFYLQSHHPGGGPPLTLPGLTPEQRWVYPPEAQHGKVTGNNAVTWSPSPHDWYETVKLNYGHDFTQPVESMNLPPANADPSDVPRTWRSMDAILAFWQELGIDGFRVDMAHLIPPPFWHWALERARQRHPDCYFFAEAYDNDPAKLSSQPILDVLLDAGFDAVYDDPLYDTLEGIYTASLWCNDLDAHLWTGKRLHRSLRYTENHDEVRLAHPREWGGHGMAVGKPTSAIAFALARGPLMLYNGQEVGEPALNSGGFTGDNARTSIFDYGVMPKVQQWHAKGRCDGAGLSADSQSLRQWYHRLLHLCQEPAFAHGDAYGLNSANITHSGFGRLSCETHSGHWLYALLRREIDQASAYLVVANFHPHLVMREVSLLIPQAARNWLGSHWNGHTLRFDECLHSPAMAPLLLPPDLNELALPNLAPLEAYFYRINPSHLDS